MSGYECSLQGGGCGRRFHSEEAFDSHMHRDKAGWPHCRTVYMLLGSGWVRDEKNYWLSPRDQKARARLAARGSVAVGDSTETAAEVGNVREST